jgi:hypothetical protein
MRTWTNLAWPDDPYRTGQQLYPRPSPRLAAFTTGRAAAGDPLAPAAAAVVCLPLHRTRALTVTGQTLTFGFHAGGADGTAQVPGLAAVAGLALMQARTHARLLAGHLPAADLAALQRVGGAALRGLAAAGHEWADRGALPGRAAMFDCGLDLPGGPPLEQACQQAGLVIHAADPGRITRPRAAARRCSGRWGSRWCAPGTWALRLDWHAGHRAGHGRYHLGLPALA